MPRPSTFCCSSMTTALVVVDPRSMPMKQRMAGSSSLHRGGDAGVGVREALLLDHLEVALEPVLDVRRREVARVHQIGLDERRRPPGAALDPRHGAPQCSRRAKRTGPRSGRDWVEITKRVTR